MAPTLHMAHPSPPSRAVLITAKAMDLDLNVKEVDVIGGESRTPEYSKMNPQHTVPTLQDDDGFAIWDSHAIMAYLVSKYGKDDSLYPKDLKKRALIDQRLHFDSGMLFPQLRRIVIELFFEGKPSVDEKDKRLVYEAYRSLDTFLDGRQWVTGDSVTIADYSLITTLSTINIVVPVDAKKFPRVAAWMKRCEGLPEYKENLKGLRIYSKWLASKL